MGKWWGRVALLSLCADICRAQVPLEGLGPMSVGKDGSLNRIANWAELTEQEQAAAKRALAKRNKKRLDALKEQEASKRPALWQRLKSGWAWLRRRLSFFRRRRIPRSRASNLPLLDFAPEYVPLIQRGEKRATTRWTGADRGGEPHLASLGSGSRVRLTCVHCGAKDEGAAANVVLRITRVERARVADLSEELARIEGFQTAGELRGALQRFYPGLDAADSVVVLHFEAEGSAAPAE